MVVPWQSVKCRYGISMRKTILSCESWH
ncbi:hypothetical protein F383_26662 [Gossypium arboreum]|uniref:Uncharacterized protein n=1 Tax=Gossypium arboreum TaxID=29729 RepID=A0A0B0P9T9_GOSAR|nr:hypothetical protein F383_26293 [Gossypium arboreum]KHG20914.1 hypothetical protein F383_26662 [Gossypium arboreum]